MLPLSKQLLVDCESDEIEYDGHCMNAPKEILDFFTETVKKVNLSDFYDIILSMGKNCWTRRCKNILCKHLIFSFKMVILRLQRYVKD